MSETERVELHPAAVWDCPNCGREQFCRMIRAEMSKEEHEEAVRAMEGLEPWESIPEGLEGEWLRKPDHVTCAHCGRTFEAVDDREEHDDE